MGCRDVYFNCLACGKPSQRAWQAKLLYCWDCYNRHDNERRRAIAKVAASIRSGQLVPASECACVDCGSPATDYEHRDYSKPLEVDPVCRSCNLKRGPGMNSFYRPSVGA